MSSLFGSLRRRVLGISSAETSLAGHGFRQGSPALREHLQAIPQAFVTGYHAALETPAPPALELRLDTVETACRGFAYEGAAMALALLDAFTPWRRWRVAAWLAGAGQRHVYMVHVGVGWALARLPGRIEGRLAGLDPLLRWLAVDGYGFHEGFFHWPRYRGGAAPPKRLAGYARRAFDQGLGRCLWFIEAAEVEHLAGTVAAFPPSRQADLWSGVGLASVYAGGVDATALRHLRQAAGPFYPCLAQGAAFAAKARSRAGLVLPHTRLACETVCRLTVEEAAQVTDETLAGLAAEGDEPAYEIWRRRVQARFDWHQP
jgi:enediyne biosynthesis protein E3